MPITRWPQAPNNVKSTGDRINWGPNQLGTEFLGYGSSYDL
jgi:hypothetical protein